MGEANPTSSQFWLRLALAAWLLLAQSIALAHERDHERALDGKSCTVCIAGHALLGSIDVDDAAGSPAVDPHPAPEWSAPAAPCHAAPRSNHTRAPPAFSI